MSDGSSTPFTHSNHPALHYQSMLADARRMQSYRQAIRRVVRAGDVVADLGTGLGILAIMAVQAGASRVYAMDSRPRALRVAQRVLGANGVADRVRLLEGDVRRVLLPEPVDVVVNELIGDFGSDENIYECVAAFAERHLKAGGRVIPSHLSTFMVPVQYGDEFRGIWRQDWQGLDLRGALEFPCRGEPVMYALRQPPMELAPPAVVEELTFGACMPARRLPGELEFRVDRAGTLQGFVGYFRATLTDGVELGNYPCYPGCHWENWNWPVEPPLQLQAGNSLQALLHIRPGVTAVGWGLDWRVG